MTKTPPTVEGQYWVSRDFDFTKPPLTQIVNVYMHPLDKCLWVNTQTDGPMPLNTFTENWMYEWFGPITNPFS